LWKVVDVHLGLESIEERRNLGDEIDASSAAHVGGGLLSQQVLRGGIVVGDGEGWEADCSRSKS
jgi:hypothetical protein